MSSVGTTEGEEGEEGGGGRMRQEEEEEGGVKLVYSNGVCRDCSKRRVQVNR